MTNLPLPERPKSYLLADIGQINTVVILIDVIEGAHRLLARVSCPSTASPPWEDAMFGMQQAIGRLTEITGRPLLDEDGVLITPMQRSGAGVDQLMITISASESLRTIMVGLLDDVSLASARSALGSIYAREIDTFSLADTRSELAQIDAIQTLVPDLIFISGGTDGGADRRLVQLIETVGIGVSLIDDSRKPEVIFAGNREIREKASAILGKVAPLHVAANVRPELDTEDLNDAGRLVQSIYEKLKIGAVPGAEDLMEWTTQSITPTSVAFARMIGYFSALYRDAVFGIDLGGSSVTLVSASNGNIRRAVRSDAGMGTPASQFLNDAQLQNICDHLSVAVPLDTLADFVQQKALLPHTVPMSPVELQFEQGIAREILRQLIAETRTRWYWNGAGFPAHRLYVLRGSTFAETPRAGQTLLMLLDALEPAGIFSVALDKHGALPALGVLAKSDPSAAIQTLEGGILQNLGWVIAPIGRAQPGQKVLSVRIESNSIGTLDVDVDFGTIEVLPLPTGESAKVSLAPHRRFNLGSGPGRGKKITISGGSVGLVIDARGRPLAWPGESDARRQIAQKWLWEIGG